MRVEIELEEDGRWIAEVPATPRALAYGATKAALNNMAESLRYDFVKMNIRIQIINPGFVETPLTAGNDFPMPFLMKPDDAARLTIAGLKKGRFEIAYPWQFVTILKIARLLPYRLFFKLIDKAVLK